MINHIFKSNRTVEWNRLIRRGLENSLPNVIQYQKLAISCDKDFGGRINTMLFQCLYYS